MRVDRGTRGCRAVAFCRFRRLVFTFALMAAAVTVALAGPAGASSRASGPTGGGGTTRGGPTGGSGIRPKARPRTRHAAVSSNPFAARGMWIWVLSRSDGGNLSSLVGDARRYGINTVMIKSGDGTSVWSQFSSGIVSDLHASGLRVCAWQYVYGDHPVTEAYVGAAAVRDGADCLVIDAESQYEGRYVAAQTYMTRLRKLIGARFPVALAGFPYVDFHPGFPYSVFLGPGGAQFNTPQMYWADIGTTVDAVYSHTYEFNRIYERPIDPLGQAFDHPRAGQIERFRQMSRSYGAAGVSWWDWQSASTGDWRALSRAVGNLHGFAADQTFATLGMHARGDVVVWAQEHLVAAGQRVTIDGSFGPQTQSAVQSFQAAHGLSPTGLVDQSTWSALLRFAPVAVHWTHHGRRTVATFARSGRLTLPVPTSATLPAKRDEIPGAGGAGWPAR
jgi:Putative peptidoglycan binding domain